MHGDYQDRSWFQTYTGVLWFSDPQPEAISLVDIARALAMTCRYNGHVRCFYSVAQHSVHVCECVAERGAPPAIQRQALLHDAAEAYTGDMVAPLKQMLPDFRILEDRIERAIATHFGVEWPWDPLVKQADLALLLAERNALKRPPPHPWSAHVPAWDHSIKPWPPEVAESHFLRFADALEIHD